MNTDSGLSWAGSGQRVMYSGLLLLICSGLAVGQSNYVQHGDSGNYTTNGLPEEATLDGKVNTQIHIYFIKKKLVRNP